MQNAHCIAPLPPGELGQAIYRIEFQKTLQGADAIRHQRWLQTYEHPLTIQIASDRRSITVGLNRRDDRLALLRWLTQNSRPVQHHGTTRFSLRQEPPTIQIAFTDGGSDDDLWGVAAVLLGHVDQGVLAASVAHGICTVEFAPETPSDTVWNVLESPDVAELVSFKFARVAQRP